MNLNVRKKMLGLLLTTTLVLNQGNVLAEENDIETNDFYKTTKETTIFLEDNYYSQSIKTIFENEVVELILIQGDWYLVKYNDLIGYIHKNDLIKEENQSEIKHILVNDIIEINSKVNFRLGPSLDAKRITSIEKGEYAKVIAKTSNNWYLVLYNGQIGYVLGDYATSMLDTINNLYPDLCLKELTIKKIVYVDASSLNVRSGNGFDYKKIATLNSKESVKVLGEFDDWYLILSNDNVLGFINKDFTKELDGQYIIIDLSEQRLWLYENNELLLTTNIVTGKTETPTRVGLFKINAKQTNRYLVGEDYNAYVNYWMPFDGGIGLHDASWRNRFGGTIYINNGSHGCVNMPSEITDDIYEKISVGTKVLVHK